MKFVQGSFLCLLVSRDDGWPPRLDDKATVYKWKKSYRMQGVRSTREKQTQELNNRLSQSQQLKELSILTHNRNEVMVG